MATVPIARDDLSFWLESSEEPFAPLGGNARAEIAIVGGGFSGLSAAYHLSREQPQLDIALVDSHRVGSGASGRNTGMLGPRVAGSIVDLVRRYGEAEARRIYQISVDAVRQVKAIISAEGIACELEECSQVKSAITSWHVAALEAEARMLEKLGFPAPMYDERGMAAISPVPYRGGLEYPESALLNPARLCRGLKQVLVSRGVRVYENTRVRRLTPGNPTSIDVADGVLTAPRVIVATNAYTAQLGVLQGQVIPIQTHVIQTERLQPAQIASLNWPHRNSFSECGHIFNYFRLTADDRIMFGGGRPLYKAADGDRHSGATDVAESRIWDRQADVFAQKFPSLRGLAIRRRWSGSLGMTLDNLPIVGELSGLPNVFFAGAWNGHGVALATSSGAMVADMVMRRGTPPVPWFRNTAPGMPPDPVRAIGLSAYLGGLGLVDRLGRLKESLNGRK